MGVSPNDELVNMNYPNAPGLSIGLGGCIRGERYCTFSLGLNFIVFVILATNILKFLGVYYVSYLR